MDLTISIKHQIIRIKELENNLPIDLILNHLERAELLYNLAIKENDENYYKDVIYHFIPKYCYLKHGILYIPNGKDEVRYIYS